MTQLVEILVVHSELLAVFARQNHGLGILRFNLRHDCVAVITFVTRQLFHLKAVNQVLSLCAICADTFHNYGSDWHTMRIHGQMYLGVEPPFIRLIP